MYLPKKKVRVYIDGPDSNPYLGTVKEVSDRWIALAADDGTECVIFTGPGVIVVLDEGSS